MDEKQLTEIASRLGSGAAERLDVDGVARRVVAELRESPARVAWWHITPVLRAAAVVAMLVSGGVIVNRLGNDAIGRPGLAAPVGLEDFSATELAEVLDSLDQITPVYQLAPASLDDLDETQLQELLAAMEG